MFILYDINVFISQYLFGYVYSYDLNVYMLTILDRKAMMTLKVPKMKVVEF